MSQFSNVISHRSRWVYIPKFNLEGIEARGNFSSLNLMRSSTRVRSNKSIFIELRNNLSAYVELKNMIQMQ